MLVHKKKKHKKAKESSFCTLLITRGSFLLSAKRAWTVRRLFNYLRTDQAGFSPAIWAALGPVRKKKKKRKFSSKIILKNLWFSANFLLHFDQYWLVFLYPIFIETLKNIKKYFVFIHMAKSLKQKKSHRIFKQIFFQKKHVLACIIDFNN
jgi:hypothetical protein